MERLKIFFLYYCSTVLSVLLSVNSRERVVFFLWICMYVLWGIENTIECILDFKIMHIHAYSV